MLLSLFGLDDKKKKGKKTGLDMMQLSLVQCRQGLGGASPVGGAVCACMC